MKHTTVLVADDHEVVRKGVIQILSAHAEFEVVGEAVDGAAAVHEAARATPELIVMDVMMPELNGLEATRQIKKNLPNTSILILSMYHSEQLIREVLMCGARGYVLKSDAGRDLVAGLTALSEGRPFFTASVTEIVLDDFLRPGRARSTEYLNGNGNVGRLSAREREIVQLLAEGNTNKKIAEKLSIGVSTVETHRAHVMQKLKLDSLGSLVRYAIRNKLVDC
jgi:DNA-binding NarL/FixJ family response regulator